MPACCCDEHRQRQRAHPRAAARAVGNVDDVDAADLQLRAPARSSASASIAARRQQLDADDERARARARCASRDFSARGDRRRCAVGGSRPRGRVAAGARAARRRGASARTASLICRMCSGVVPQQPPTSRTPLLMKRRAYDAMYSGEQR